MMRGDKDPALEAIKEFIRKQAKRKKPPSLNIDDYRKLLRAIAPPTDEQIEAFARFTTRAKSWYKHLPFFPPCPPFHFYVDPWAGLDRVIRPNGTLLYIIRTERSQPLHYTSTPTEEYRSRFGRLEFACMAGSGLAMPVRVELNGGEIVEGMVDIDHGEALIGIEDNGKMRVPDEILKAGSVEVTAIIHPDVTVEWSALVQRAHLFGGTAPPAFVELKSRIDALQEAYRARRETLGPDDDIWPVFRELLTGIDAILAPERDRMHQGMVDAMKRMREVAWG